MCVFTIYFIKNLSLFYSTISLFMCQGIIITSTKVFDEKELYLVNKSESVSSMRMRTGCFLIYAMSKIFWLKMDIIVMILQQIEINITVSPYPFASILSLYPYDKPELATNCQVLQLYPILCEGIWFPSLWLWIASRNTILCVCRGGAWSVDLNNGPPQKAFTHYSLEPMSGTS